jgi:hypothetical protein
MHFRGNEFTGTLEHLQVLWRQQARWTRLYGMVEFSKMAEQTRSDEMPNAPQSVIFYDHEVLNT